MHFTTTLIMIVAAISQTSCQLDDAIIRTDFDGPHDDESYRSFQTAGGIYTEQTGSLQPGRSGEPSLSVQGPDGQEINVKYIADDEGFVATGADIPTPPPIQPMIQHALDYLASAPILPSTD